MTRAAQTSPAADVERALLVSQPVEGAPVEYDVWPERPVTIGRDASNTVVIDSPFVSKSHAVIRYANGAYTVEDLKSANGTRVNGVPIEVAVLTPGDTLEVGDLRFHFREGRPGAAGGQGLSKNTKLALAAIATLGVLGTLFALIISAGQPPPASGQSTKAASAKTTEAAVEIPPVDVNSQAVRDVLEHAEQAGIKPAEALFDEANIALGSGRLREAAELYGAVLARDPKNASAQQRFADARSQWAQAIHDHAAEAERAADELRLNDAILEWGKVVLLTDATDPRHRAAQDGIDRARQRLAR
ncbi:MAG: FHA domain-containing protein [Vicinamibacterales bacterium]